MQYFERRPSIDAVKVPYLGREESPYTGWEEFPEWLKYALDYRIITAVFDHGCWRFIVKYTNPDGTQRERMASPDEYIVLVGGDYRVMTQMDIQRNYEPAESRELTEEELKNVASAFGLTHKEEGTDDH